MSSFRRRQPADWVFRPNLRDEEGAVLDTTGSYEQLEGQLDGGFGNANVAILYDSHNFIQQSAYMGFQTFFPSWARSEGGSAKILRVQGTLMWRPSTWAIGDTYNLAVRFGVFEQDPNGGAVLTHANYNLWGTGVASFMNTPAQFANDRDWQWEWRNAESFNQNTTFWEKRFSFRVNRRLNPDQCYAMWLESTVGSVRIFHRRWFKTLVVDEAGG